MLRWRWRRPSGDLELYHLPGRVGTDLAGFAQRRLKTGRLLVVWVGRWALASWPAGAPE